MRPRRREAVSGFACQIGRRTPRTSPTRTRFSSRRPPSSKSRRQSEECPLARQYAPTLDKWLDGLVATFGHVIQPVDVTVAMRAGELMRSWRGGLPIHRFHDVLLVATAQGPWPWPTDQKRRGLQRLVPLSDP